MESPPLPVPTASGRDEGGVGTTISVCLIILLVIIVFGSVLYIDSYLRELNHEIKNMKHILITQLPTDGGTAIGRNGDSAAERAKMHKFRVEQQNTIENIKNIMKSFDVADLKSTK